ncbi:MAG: hydroxymethylglutaryl-CoA lyase [Ignavibacteriae bacterium HGW-Ignavibacteriae-1]|nr:MAG: hydroxymethylglutaryl-CoA lyase [Ignavibacteriae bacterium HGW-Ignavibacteriae-1]
MMSEIKIHEVGLRDGLQNESKILPTQNKIEWAEKLAQSGIDILQIGSFVHPTKMPQMADTDEILEYFKSHKPTITLSALVLNEKGLERAYASQVDLICMGVSASETHSQKNTGMSVSNALERISKMAIDAKSNGSNVQVSVQSAFGCGFEGKISEKTVLSIIESYFNKSLNNISLADTAGHAYPQQVERIIQEVYRMNKDANITVHFHNTYGLGIANCYAAMNCGVKTFETAFGGLGGCPFTKVAAGNVSTEDFVHLLHRNELRTDIQIEKITEVSRLAEAFFEKKLQSYVYNTGIVNY